MAFGYWPDFTPGTEYGPCVEPCGHVDCAYRRKPEHANPVCKLCGNQLQTGDRFYDDREYGPCHAPELEDRIEAEQAARLARP